MTASGQTTPDILFSPEPALQSGGWSNQTLDIALSCASTEPAQCQIVYRLNDSLSNIPYTDPIRFSGEAQYILHAARDTGSEPTFETFSFGIDKTAPDLVYHSERIDPGTDDGLTRVTFHFTEPMSRSATQSAIQGGEGWIFTWDTTDQWLSMTPLLPVEGATATIVLTADAQDAHGVRFGQNVERTINIRGPRDYAVTSIPYAFVNITQTGADTGIYCNDSCGRSAQLPFAFTYSGHTFDELNISPNGFVTFGTNACLGVYVPQPFPGNCPNLVAPFWENLDTRLGAPGPQPVHPDKILTHTVGEAPHRTFIVSWSAVHHYPNALPRATFQIQLHEGSNDIDFQYERALSDDGNHMVGLVNGNRTRHTTYAFRPLGLIQTGLRFAEPGTQGDTTPPTVIVTGSEGRITGADASVIYTFSEPMDRAETRAALEGAAGWTTTWNEASTVLEVSIAEAPLGTTTLILTTRAADAQGVRMVAPVTRAITRASDTSPPDLFYTITPTANSRGWTTQTTTVVLSSNESDALLTSSIDGADFIVGAQVNIPEGEHTLRLRATDAAGNLLEIGPLTLRVDTLPPAVTANVTPLANEQGWRTTATHIALASEPGATTSLALDEGDFANWTLFEIPEGIHTIHARATDTAGNVGNLTPFIVRVDTLAPTLNATLSSKANAAGWHNSATTVTLETEPGATTSLSLDDGSYTNGTVFSIPEGIHTIHPRATDTAGNQGELTAFTVRVDTVAPTVTPSGDIGILPDTAATMVFNFSEAMDRNTTESALSGIAGWSITWNDASTNITFARTDIPIGTHTILVNRTATDAHGVALVANGTRSITRPPPPPPAPPEAPDPPTRLAVELSGTVATLHWDAPMQTHGAPVTSYRVYVDGTLVSDDLTTSFTTPLARGAIHTFRVTAVNSGGESRAATGSATLPPVSRLNVTTTNTSGWYRTAPLVEILADPTDALVIVDMGAGPQEYSGAFSIPVGITTLTWHARAGGLDEAPHHEEFRVDRDAPVIDSASISSPTLSPGNALGFTVRASDALSGIARVDALLTPRAGGAPMRLAIARDADGAFRGTLSPGEGSYDASVVATDRAGNEARAEAGPVTVANVTALAPETNATSPDGALPDTPLQASGTPGTSSGQAPGGTGGQSAPATTPTPSAGSAENGSSSVVRSAVADDTPRPAPPAFVIEQPKDVGAGLGAGARGIITIRLTGVEDIENVSVLVFLDGGDVTVLSRGEVETRWDTTTVGDGYYTLEARRSAPRPGEGQVAIAQQGAATIVSVVVLVRNDVATPQEVAGAVVGGVFVAATVNAGLSAVGSGATSAASSATGGVDPLGFLKDVVMDASEDKLKDKTKDKAALDRKRRIRSWVAAISSLVVLVSLWAFSEADERNLRGWLIMLPIAGGAAAIVTLLKYGSESAMAWVTKAKPRIRLWVGGVVALAVSAVFLRDPFGYPGYVEETDEDEGRSSWRMQGLRALGTIAGAAAFLIPFLAVSTFAPWNFVDIGLLIAITNVSTACMPFGPLPGKDVWRWNKWISVSVAIVGTALYLAYSAAFMPMWGLWALSLAGGVAYVVSLVLFKRKFRPKHQAREAVGVVSGEGPAPAGAGGPPETSRDLRRGLGVVPQDDAEKPRPAGRGGIVPVAVSVPVLADVDTDAPHKRHKRAPRRKA